MDPGSLTFPEYALIARLLIQPKRRIDQACVRTYGSFALARLESLGVTVQLGRFIYLADSESPATNPWVRATYEVAERLSPTIEFSPFTESEERTQALRALANLPRRETNAP